MNMNKLLLVLWAGVMTASPAAATIVFNGNTASLTAASVGTSFAVRYDGLVNGNVAAGLKASALITLSSITNGGKSWNFAITLANQSELPMTQARLSGFGMSLDAFKGQGGTTSITSASTVAAGSNPLVFGQVLRASDLGDNINVPQLGKIADVCFMAGTGTTNNCSGGGGGGLLMGNPFPTASQEFTLGFSKSVSTLNISNLFVRWQSLSGAGHGTSGVGRGTFDPGGGLDPGGDPVPEPASWAMMIAGFGFVGAMARRRRAITA